MEKELRKSFKKARRIVVKVGSALLTNDGAGLDRRYIVRLARSIATLMDQGRQIALVTSGAVGAGVRILGYNKRPASLPERQACAAAGQPELMKLYTQAFKRLKPARAVGQLLLTRDGLEDRKRYLNARNTVEALLARGALPIVNENDTVSFEEIRFGDNDKLSALVAVAIDADLLIVLSDVPGLMDKPPREHPDAQLLPYIAEITPEIEALASPKGSFVGTGGMVSKLQAAKLITSAGESMVLAGGRQPEVLERIVNGEAIGTCFAPRATRLDARRRWLAFSAREAGIIIVDDGAKEALLKRKKSLLPSGIVGVKGSFAYGDLVGLAGPDLTIFARGLSNFTHLEIERIKGLKSSALPELLGESTFNEVVHRDNLVVVE